MFIDLTSIIASLEKLLGLLIICFQSQNGCLLLLTKKKCDDGKVVSEENGY